LRDVRQRNVARRDGVAADDRTAHLSGCSMGALCRVIRRPSARRHGADLPLRALKPSTQSSRQAQPTSAAAVQLRNAAPQIAEPAYFPAASDLWPPAGNCAQAAICTGQQVTGPVGIDAPPGRGRDFAAHFQPVLGREATAASRIALILAP
jgi:hypothetical protein